MPMERFTLSAWPRRGKGQVKEEKQLPPSLSSAGRHSGTSAVAGGLGRRQLRLGVQPPGISMLKRRLASGLTGRSNWSQGRELLWLAITYNIMLLYVITGFRLSNDVLF